MPTKDETIAERFAAEAQTLRPALLPIPDDPWRFVLDCCYTYDELAKTLGLEPKRGFPDKAYLKQIVVEWLANPTLRIEKSRQIMVTWLLAALWLWWVLKNPGQRVAWICKTFTDASDHLEKRVAKMYEQIPETYDKPRAKFVDGEFRVWNDPTSSIPSSTIEAIAAEKGQHADASSQLRSFTYSGVYWDEAAFQPNQDEVYASGMPCVGIGGRFNVVSSANGKNFFWRLGHGDLDESSPDPVSSDTSIEKSQVLKGFTVWTHNGFRNLRVHYSSDPDKDPDTETGRKWFEASKARMRITRKWNREMEIDFGVPSGQPVYCDTDRIVAVEQVYRAPLKVFRCWDFGFGTPVCIVKQGEPILAEDGKTILKVRIHVLKEFTGHSVDIANFYEGTVKPWFAKYLPRVSYQNQNLEDFGDPAGNQKESTSGKSDIEVLKALGVRVKSKASRVETTRLDDETGRVNLLQAVISAGDLEIDPDKCPGLLADLCGGYHRDEFGKIVKDGEHDHRPDALGYGISNLLGLDKRGLGHVQRTVEGSPLPTAQPDIVRKERADESLTRNGWGAVIGPVNGTRTRRTYTPKQWNPKEPARPGTSRRLW